MRPRLLADVRLIPRPDGLHLVSDGAAQVLHGPDAHEWMQRLAPHLDGERSLASLSAGLSPAHRAVVEKLVGDLHQHGFVVDASADLPHALPEAALVEYREEIGFIRYSHDSPERRFERLRDAHVLVIGDGLVAVRIAEAGLHSGWGRLTLCSDGPITAASGLEALRRDPQQTVMSCQKSAWPGLVGIADLVVEVTTAAGRHELLEVSRRCAASGLALLQAAVRADDAWVTAVQTDGAALRAARSAWRWLTSTGADRGAAEHDWLTGAAPCLIAAHVALGCFRYLTGTDARQPCGAGADRTRQMLTRFDLPALTTSSHQYPEHPGEGRGAGEHTSLASVRQSALRAAGTLAASDLLGRAEDGVDAWCGPLVHLDEEDLPQVPVALCAARVRHPADGSVERVVGWGPDRKTARVRAVLAAAARQAVLSCPSGDAVRWGVDLLSRENRAVLPQRDPACGAGLSWDAAVRSALLLQHERLLCDDPGRARPVCDSRIGGTARAMLSLLRAVAPAAELRRHDAPSGLPTYSVYEGDLRLAIATGCEESAAVLDVLERALARWQSDGSVIVAPGACPWVGQELRATPSGFPAPADQVRLARQLRRLTGRTPVIVAACTDARLFPFAAEMMLCG